MMHIRALVVVSFWLIFVMTGCVPTSELYIGKPMTSAPTVKLQDGPNTAGTWQTFDVTINYNYTVDNGILDISGQGELSQHYQMMYRSVRSMRTYLFLLDADGIIIATVNLPTFLINTEDKFNFNRSFKAGDGVEGFSFGYRGVVVDAGDQKYFDSLP